MTTFPNSPRLFKGGIVLIDPEMSVVQRVVTEQLDFSREKNLRKFSKKKSRK